MLANVVDASLIIGEPIGKVEPNTPSKNADIPQDVQQIGDATIQKTDLWEQPKSDEVLATSPEQMMTSPDLAMN